MKQVIVRPHLTEKSLALAAKGYYTFAVAKFARKEEIKSAIHNLYNVHVLEARTIAMSGKARRAGKKMKAVAKTPWKKAIVKLAVGEKIDAFEISKEEKKT
ncbi:50S ribosomal protein L23 [Candidatus Gottesmanbacteria bacterium]|nr:50S ribosomal protein L23 [Candidatus Gottesmanbacteria bacterium]